MREFLLLVLLSMCGGSAALGYALADKAHAPSPVHTSRVLLPSDDDGFDATWKSQSYGVLAAAKRAHGKRAFLEIKVEVESK